MADVTCSIGRRDTNTDDKHQDDFEVTEGLHGREQGLKIAVPPLS